MTKRKAPAAGTGINPKLTALTEKLDEAHALVQRMQASRAASFLV